MKLKSHSIRPFIGSKNFNQSRRFYQTIGFKEIVLSEKLSYFKDDSIGFYLQDYYVKDWVDNSMIFLEVNQLELHWSKLKNLELPTQFEQVKISAIVENDWGSEFFLHDPSGILWHIGTFNQ